MTWRVRCTAAARLLVVLIAALTQSCGVQLPEGRYRCDNQGDCPSGWSCHEDARCYPYAAANVIDAGAADSGKLTTGEQLLPEAGAVLDGATDAQASDGGTGPVQSAGTGGTEPALQDAGSDAGCSSKAAGYCDGDSPVHCMEGAWINQSACAGATPICSRGSCVTLRLARGQLGLAPLTAATSSAIRLRQHALGAVSTTCGETRSGAVCVTGSIQS